jgi:hypothetical protein
MTGDPLRDMCDPVDGRLVGRRRRLRRGHGPARRERRAQPRLLPGGRALQGAGAAARRSTRCGESATSGITANAAYWTSGTTYAEACRGTIDAARALGNGERGGRGAGRLLADVGVGLRERRLVCDNDGDCDAGDGETCASCSDDCGSCSEDCSGWKKAKCRARARRLQPVRRRPGCGDRICDGDETDETAARTAAARRSAARTWRPTAAGATRPARTSATAATTGAMSATSSRRVAESSGRAHAGWAACRT